MLDYPQALKKIVGDTAPKIYTENQKQTFQYKN